MRLIDADKLYDWVRRECNPYGKPTIDFESGNRMLDMIKRSSTAFDKEKVILELSKKRYEALKMRDDENTSCTTELKSFWHSRLEAYTLAIEVIEKGGIE